MSELDGQEFNEEADVVEVPDVAAIDAIQVEESDVELDGAIAPIDEAIIEEAPEGEATKKPSWLIPVLAVAGVLALVAALVAGLFYFVDDFKLPGFSTADFGDAARVNKGSVTQKQLNAEMSRIELSQPGIFDVENGGVDEAMVRSQTLDELINQELLLQKAKEEGIEVSSEDVDAELENTKAQFGDEYESALEQYGFTEQDLRDRLTFQFLMDGLIDMLVPKDSVTDAEVQAYYDENKEGFTEAPGKQVSHILFDLDDEEKAKETLALLQSGEGDFAALATELSQDPGSAAHGGDLGWGSSDAYVPEFKAVVDELAEGEMSDLVQTQFGWHIIKITDTREEGIIPFEQVKEDIRNMLYQQEMSATYQDLITALRDEATIEILDPVVLAYRESLEDAQDDFLDVFPEDAQ